MIVGVRTRTLKEVEKYEPSSSQQYKVEHGSHAAVLSVYCAEGSIIRQTGDVSLIWYWYMIMSRRYSIYV